MTNDRASVRTYGNCERSRYNVFVERRVVFAWSDLLAWLTGKVLPYATRFVVREVPNKGVD